MSGDMHEIQVAALRTFEYISENEYRGQADGYAQDQQSLPCQCTDRCDEDCINRQLNFECDAGACPFGADYEKQCHNRRFQRCDYAPLQIFAADGKGYGLRATQSLPAHEFVIEYIGEVLSQQAFIKRTRQYERESIKHFYFMALKQDQMIDATKRGGLARFMNHSCDPNCELQKWNVGCKLRMGLFTTRQIAEGEELTFDYRFERFGAPAQPCFCGSVKCKGTIGTSKGNSSSAESSASEFEDDEDEYDQAILNGKRRQQSKGIENEQHCIQLIKKMQQGNDGQDTRFMRFLDRLSATTDSSILRRFIQLHGLMLLKQWINPFKNQHSIVRKAVQCIQKLPITTRNTIEEVRMDQFMQQFTSSSDIIVSTGSQQLIKDWQQLPLVYKIPKRATSEAPDDENSVDKSTAGTSVPPPPVVAVRNTPVFRPRSPPQERRPSLPSGWGMAFDDGGTYYLHLETSTRSREFPHPHVITKLLADGKLKPQVTKVTDINGVSQDTIQAIIERANREAASEERRRREEKQLKRRSSVSSVSDKRSRHSAQSPTRSEPAATATATVVVDMQNLRENLSTMVIKYLSRHKQQIGTSEDFKKHARKITHAIMEKESRAAGSNSGDPDEMKRKVKKFVDMYAEKLVSRTNTGGSNGNINS